ncbi:hypothetical protein ACOMHN_008825 [Nucella lapillus]
MFEIPDDDDLFNEDNLGDFFHNLSHHGAEQQKQTYSTVTNTGHTSFLRMSGSSQKAALVAPLSEASEGLSQEPESPKTKKMRVLTDVNCLATATTDSADGDNTMLPRRRSLRKFPGPAGILPPAKPSELASIMKKSVGASPEIVSEDSGGSKPEEEVCSSQASGEAFGGVAWQSLIADLHPDTDKVLTKFSVRAMLHKASRRQLPKGKVPLMVGVLESIDLQGTDASVVLRDPTGQMQGTLHREAVKDFSVDLQTGAALVLRQVSVISPSSRTHYLNITSGNIVAIYLAQGNRAPTVPPPSPDQPPSAGPQPCQELMKHCVQAAEMELLEAANAAKETALRRLRQRGSPAQTSSSPSPGAPVGRPASRLFSHTPFQGGRGAVSGPFTPPTPRPVSAAGSGAGGCRFRTACASPQVRTPTPVQRGTTGHGEASAVGISGVNSAFPHGSVAGGSSQQTTGSRSLNSVGQSAQSSPGGGGNWNSGYHYQNASSRLLPSTSCKTNVASGVKQGTQTSVTASSASIHRLTSSGPGGPSVPCSSTRANSVRSASSPVTSDQTPSHSGTFTQASSQQSKWSFKRKLSEPASQPKPGDINANSEGEVQRLQQTEGDPVNRLQGSAAQHAGCSGATSVAGPATTVSATSTAALTASMGDGAFSAANMKGASNMWEDELDDDILSQLSDDF